MRRRPSAIGPRSSQNHASAPAIRSARSPSPRPRTGPSPRGRCRAPPRAVEPLAGSPKALPDQVWLGLFDQREEVLGVASLDSTASPLEASSRSSANSRIVSYIQNRSSVRRTRLFSTSDWSVSRSASATRRPPRACAAGEDRQTCEQALLRRVEEVVRPLDRRAERPLARVGVAAAGEQVEALGEPFEDLRRGEDLRTRGGQLDREGHLVEGPTELADRLVGLRDAGAGREELDRVRLGERPHRVLDLAADAEALPARRQHAQVRARLDEVGERRPRLDHLLEVVEDEEHLALADVVGEVVLGPERLRDLVGDERRVAERRELDPERAGLVIADQLGGGLDRQAGLAGAAGARERDEASAVVSESASRPRPRAPGRRTSSPGGAGSCSRSSSAAGSARRRAGRSGPAARSPSGGARRGRASGPPQEPRLQASCRSRGAPGRRGRRRRSWRRGARRGRRIPPVRGAAHRCGSRRGHGSDRAGAPPGPPRPPPTASPASGNAKKNASPCVSTSTPPWRPNASRSSRRCSARASRVRLRAELVEQPRRALDVGEHEGDGAGGEIGPAHRA